MKQRSVLPRWQLEADLRAAESAQADGAPDVHQCMAVMMHEMVVGFGWAMLSMTAGAVALKVLVKVVFQ